ncbi:type II secretion system minor pseudopilin GspH [Pseudaeromonas pectinilytica]
MPSKSRGFTLIEIMLVMVIIGCAVGIVVLSMPGVGSQGDGDIKTQSERLQALVSQIAEQAMLEGRTIGLRVDKSGYQFMVRQQKSADQAVTTESNQVATAWDDQVWVNYEKEKLLTKATFPEGTEVELELGGLALDNEENRVGLDKVDWFSQRDETNPEPQILLLPGGEITPFQLTLTPPVDEDANELDKNYIQLRGDETGQVRVLTRSEVEAEAKE